ATRPGSPGRKDPNLSVFNGLPEGCQPSKLPGRQLKNSQCLAKYLLTSVSIASKITPVGSQPTQVEANTDGQLTLLVLHPGPDQASHDSPGRRPRRSSAMIPHSPAVLALML